MARHPVLAAWTNSPRILIWRNMFERFWKCMHEHLWSGSGKVAGWSSSAPRFSALSLYFAVPAFRRKTRVSLNLCAAGGWGQSSGLGIILGYWLHMMTELKFQDSSTIWGIQLASSSGRTMEHCFRMFPTCRSFLPCQLPSNDPLLRKPLVAADPWSVDSVRCAIGATSNSPTTQSAVRAPILIMDYISNATYINMYDHVCVYYMYSIYHNNPWDQFLIEKHVCNIVPGNSGLFRASRRAIGHLKILGFCPLSCSSVLQPSSGLLSILITWEVVTVNILLRPSHLRIHAIDPNSELSVWLVLECIATAFLEKHVSWEKSACQHTKYIQILNTYVTAFVSRLSGAAAWSLAASSSPDIAHHSCRILCVASSGEQSSLERPSSMPL